MGRTYLRYKQSAVNGLIASPGSNVAVDTTGKLVFTAQLENVGIWNIRRGVQIQQLTPPGADANIRSEVTCIEASPNGKHVAVGYADGMIRLFDHGKVVLAMALNGHGKGVTALSFNSNGTQLASGAKDTDVILWDVVGEAGVCRLRGHKDEVTDVAFLRRPDIADAGAGSAGLAATGKQTLLVTCSKDTLLKVWDLVAQRCIQTIVGMRVEVWSLCVPPAGEGESDRVVAGGGDNLLRVWSVGTRPTQAIANSSQPASALSAVAASLSDEQSSGGDEDSVLQPMGSITRQTHERASLVRCSEDGRLMAVQCAGKTIECFRRRSPTEVRKRIIRRLRRHREKVSKKAKAAAAADNGNSDNMNEDGDDEMNEDTMMDAEFAGTSLAELDAQIKALEAAEAGTSADAIAALGVNAGIEHVIASDEWELVGIAHAHHKISSFSFLPAGAAGDDVSGAVASRSSSSAGVAQNVTLLLALQNNQMEIHTLPLNSDAVTSLDAKTITTSAGIQVPQALHSRSVALGGHRSDIRAVAVSSDGALILSCSNGQAKVWNAKSGAALRTLELGDTVGLTAAFCPGNRHAVIGCKDGRLMLFDLSSSDMLEEHAAHSGALWSLAIRPDGKGLVTGSADKDCKFWDFDLVDKLAESDAADAKQKGKGKDKKADQQPAVPSAPAVKVLTLVHVRTLKVNEEVLCVRYSNTKDSTKLLLAVALLDSTIKVFFDDTLKFALSLYGHKLPVMSMDISQDGTLLVSASADKNVKVWGLDFGDCHKSFLAHQDSVMAVGFVANTHYFFTAGKDKVLKYWDGDRFEHILTLEGHKSEVWCLAVAPDGSYLVSGSHDRSLRIWGRTEEQVFLEEEREKEFDNMLEKDLRDPDGDAVLNGNDMIGKLGPDGLAVITDKDADGPVNTVSASGRSMPESSSVVAHATRETIKGTDRLLEALTLANEETEKWTEYAQDVAAATAAGQSGDVVSAPTRNPEMLNLTPSAYVLRTMRAIRPSDIDQVLLTLPFSDAARLLRYLHHLLRNSQGIELCTRAALLLLRVHHAQLSSNATMLPLVVGLREAMQSAVQSSKDHVGFNIAGLSFMDKVLSDVQASSFMGDGVTADARVATAGRKQREAEKAAAKAKEGEGFRIGKRAKVNLL